MALSADVESILSLSAGALIFILGAFVLAARPASGLHRAFFLFAVADAGSTAFFTLRDMTDDVELRLYAYAGYWFFFIAFDAALLGFVLLFPRPLFGPAARRWLLAFVLVAGASTTLLYWLRPTWFWNATLEGGTLTFLAMPGSYLLRAVFVGSTALAMGKLAYESTHSGQSASARRQAAFVLGGLVVGFAPYATTAVARRLLQEPTQFIEASPLPLSLYWSQAAACGVLVVAAVVIARDREPTRRGERTMLLAAIGLVALLTALAFAWPASYELLSVLGLLAYPALLGYAIARYGVLGIDAALRRTATLTVAASAAAGAFVLVQEYLEDLLHASVFGLLPLAGALAALSASALAVPVTKIASRLALRVLPELEGDALQARKLEIYRHSVEAAAADGAILRHESRALAALRQSLGVTDEEHERVLRESRLTAQT